MSHVASLVILRNGSIIVDFELIFTSEVDKPLEPLMDVAETGKLGNMTFEIKGEKIFLFLHRMW